MCYNIFFICKSVTGRRQSRGDQHILRIVFWCICRSIYFLLSISTFASDVRAIRHLRFFAQMHPQLLHRYSQRSIDHACRNACKQSFSIFYSTSQINHENFNEIEKTFFYIMVSGKKLYRQETGESTSLFRVNRIQTWNFGFNFEESLQQVYFRTFLF